MNCRILIENKEGLYQVILDEEKKEVKDIITNLKNLLDMRKVSDFILITDCKNYNGCDISVHGNAEKIAKQYDALTQFMISKDPHILMRVISVWDERMKND